MARLLPSFLNSLPSGLPVIWTPSRFGFPLPVAVIIRETATDLPKSAAIVPNRFLRAHLMPRINFSVLKKAYIRAPTCISSVTASGPTAQARRSGLAQYAKSIRTIHYGMDLEQLTPLDKNIARKALQIPEGKFVIGFSCLDFNERRKGAEILMEALKTFPANEIVLLVLGAGKWPASGD